MIGTQILRTDAKVALVVVGARSGTSALAGTLGMMGCGLPRRLMAADAANEKGYFEPDDLAGLHDEILASVGSAWDDWRPFPAGWFGSTEAQVYRRRLVSAFRDNYAPALTPLVKEPRMSRLLPLWDRVFVDLGLAPVFCFIDRPPVEVARSLHARDGSSIRQGMLYYSRNHLDAEYASRGRRRIVVTYDRLLKDWRTTTARIGSRLRVALSFARAAEIDAFLEPALCHQTVGTCPVPGDDASELAQQVHQAFRCLADGQWGLPLYGRFNRMRRAINRQTG